MNGNDGFIPGRFAFFDFDGTLFEGDSILPFLLHCVRRRVAPVRQLPKALFAFVKWKMNPDFASGAKEAALSFLKGKTQSEICQIARCFFREKGQKRFFRQGREEIDRLHREGYRVIVVSASPEIYLTVLPEFLPVDDVLATPCELDDGMRFTGKAGVNCKGEEKTVRIARYLAEHQWNLDSDVCCSYGDSPSDCFMFELAGQPVLVNPGRRLLRRMDALPCRHVRWNP